MPNGKAPPSGMSAGAVIQTTEVAHFPAIAALPLNEQMQLLPRLRRRVILPNRIIFQKGELGTHMGFVASGSLKVRNPKSANEELIVALLGPGDYFGEIGMITKRVRSFDVVSIDRAEVFELTRDDFIAHTQSYTGLSFSLLVSVAGRLDDAGKRIIDLGEEDIPTRILRVLSKLANPIQTIRGMRLVVSPRPSQHDLTGLIGAPREKVWDVLRTLERNGYITIEEERIVIELMPVP